MLTEKEFNSVFKEYNFQLFVYCRDIVYDEFIAEDIVSKAFVRLWTAKHHDSIRAFLYITVNNLSKDWLRHKRRILDNIISLSPKVSPIEDMNDRGERMFKEHNIGSDFNLEASYIRSELLNMIRKDIQQMPPARKKVAIMIMEGYKTDDISDLLGISMDTIRGQKKKIIDFLRAKYLPQHEKS